MWKWRCNSFLTQKSSIYICSIAVHLHSTLLSHVPDSAAVERIVNSSNSVTEGESFEMTCETTGDPEPNVYWIKGNNGALLNGSVLNFTNINRNDTGQYRCQAENICGSASSVQSIEVSCKYELFFFFLIEKQVFAIYQITAWSWLYYVK